jgi:hypothetical protein
VAGKKSGISRDGEVTKASGKDPSSVSHKTRQEEVAGEETTNEDVNKTSLSTVSIAENVCYHTGLVHSTADSGTYDHKHFAKGQHLYGTSCIHATCKRYFVDKLKNMEDVNEVRPQDGIYNPKKPKQMRVVSCHRCVAFVQCELCAYASSQTTQSEGNTSIRSTRRRIRR